MPSRAGIPFAVSPQTQESPDTFRGPSTNRGLVSDLFQRCFDELFNLFRARFRRELQEKSDEEKTPRDENVRFEPPRGACLGREWGDYAVVFGCGYFTGQQMVIALVKEIDNPGNGTIPW